MGTKQAGWDSDVGVFQGCNEEQHGKRFRKRDEGKKGEMEERFGGRETDGGG